MKKVAVETTFGAYLLVNSWNRQASIHNTKDVYFVRTIQHAPHDFEFIDIIQDPYSHVWYKHVTPTPTP